MNAPPAKKEAAPGLAPETRPRSTHDGRHSNRCSPGHKRQPGRDRCERELLPVELLVTDYARRGPDDDTILRMDRPPARRKSGEVNRLLSLLDSLEPAERRSA